MALQQTKSKPHICIIGAGVAGLRCADVLLRKAGGGNNIKVTVLEGRGRVGGRLCQSKSLDGSMVDVGPNWIHGTSNNPILDLARETDTKLHRWDGRQAVFDSRGTLVPDEEAEKCNDVLWGLIAEAFKFSSDSEVDSIPADKSLLDFFEERVDRAVRVRAEAEAETEELDRKKCEGNHDGLENSSRLVEKLERRRELVLQMAHLWGAFVGTSVARQSLRFFWLEKSLDGEDVFVAETFEKILKRMAEPLLIKAEAEAEVDVELKLGSVVTAIESTVGDDSNDQIWVKVRTTNSEAMQEFDGVVITTPLGWLKQSLEAFRPALPEGLRLAIDSISYGKLDKVYIKFPKAWWNEGSRKESSKSHTSPGPDILQTTTLNTNKTVHGQKQGSPGFLYWAPSQFSQSLDFKDTSAQTCINMAALPDNCNHPTLLFYTYGSASEYVAKLARQNSSSSSSSSYSTSAAASTSTSNKRCTITPSIIGLFKPYFSKLPNYNSTNPSCTPVAMLTTCWADDELAGYGSYSNFQVGLESGDKDIERMREGMPERRVWFAGEHTAPFIATGTVTGAYWSGEKVAEKVAEALGVGDGSDGLTN